MSTTVTEDIPRAVSKHIPNKDDRNSRHYSCQAYKLIVAYDGTRFHGFQRQIDNETMMKQYRDKKLLASLRPKKRPHYYDVDTACYHNGDGDGDAASREKVTRGVEQIPRIRKGCNISVQEVLEFVLLDMFNPPTSPSTAVSVQDISLTFAGRTDKGVHANGQVCLVQLPRPSRSNDIDDDHKDPSMIQPAYDVSTGTTNTTSYFDYHSWKLRNDMNSRLPLDISVQHVLQLPVQDASSFDPRRDVTLKQYTYTVRYRRCHTPHSTNGASRSESDQRSKSIDDKEKELHQMIEQSGGPHSIRSAMDTYCLWIVPWVLLNDEAIISNMCQHFMGTQRNFYYFIHKADRDNPNKTTMHNIEKMSYEVINRSTECISNASSQHLMNVSSEIITGRFTFIAKSFRRTMIRNIVGYCIDACRPNLPNVPSVESILSIHHNSTQKIDGNPTSDGNDHKAEKRHHYIINAAPASGLCLESVTY